MVNFQKAITVSKGTTEATLEATTLSITQGRLKWARIKFFKGPESTVHVRIKHNNRQVLPANIDAEFTGNDDGIPIHSNIPLPNPDELKIECWNTDSIHDHDILVEVEIEVPTPQSAAEQSTEVYEQRPEPVPNLFKTLGLIR